MHIPEDLEDLIDLRVTREQGLARAHFGEDATNRPHVDAGGVLSAAEKDFGRTIP